MPENVPPVNLGDPLMSIDLPNFGETLGLRFSVFGKCDAITPTNTPTMTATFKVADQEVATGSLTMNPEHGTYEAVFELPHGMLVEGTGKIEVTCSGMNTPATVGQLSVREEEKLTIGTPTPGSWFPGWTSSEMLLRGNVATEYAGMNLWVRVTDRGHDVIGAHEQLVGTDGSWEFAFYQLVSSNRWQLPTGRNMSVHVSVWQHYGSAALVRVSSGYFWVGTPT